MATTYSTEHERAAHALGVEAAKAAASWVVDGNTPTDHARRLLAMLDDGDPRADDYLPARPNLSGDAPTPASLAREILDVHPSDLYAKHGAGILDAIADAWEAGVMNTFEAECERILRAALPDDDDSSEDR